MAINQPLSASLTLFANILQHPEDPDAISHLGRINTVVELVGQLVARNRLCAANGTLLMFKELYRVAQLCLDRDAREGDSSLGLNTAIG